MKAPERMGSARWWEHRPANPAQTTGFLGVKKGISLGRCRDYLTPHM